MNDTWAVTTLDVVVRNVQGQDTLLDIFNATGSTKKLEILQIKLGARAARKAYASQDFPVYVHRTVAKGVGGLTETLVAHDLLQPALPLQITARSNPNFSNLNNITERVLASSMFHDEAPFAEPATHIVYRYGGEPQRPLIVRPGGGLVIRHGATGNTAANLAIEILFSVSAP